MPNVNWKTGEGLIIIDYPRELMNCGLRVSGSAFYGFFCWWWQEVRNLS